MHAFIYLCVEIGSDSLSLNVFWAMLMRMYLREIPVLVTGLFLHVYLPGVNILNKFSRTSYLPPMLGKTQQVSF